MKKPKFNFANIRKAPSIFDELLECYKSTEFSFFAKTDTPTHLQHFWKTIFFTATWVIVVYLSCIYIGFLPDGIKMCLLFTTTLIVIPFLNLERYIYSEDNYIPLNDYRRKLIRNFISSHSYDYRKLATQLINICNEQRNSDVRAISIALTGFLAGFLTMIFNFFLIYVIDGFKEFLNENNVKLYEPNAIQLFGRITYIFLLPIASFIFYLYLSEFKDIKYDRMRIIVRLIQETLLERETKEQ